MAPKLMDFYIWLNREKFESEMDRHVLIVTFLILYALENCSIKYEKGDIIRFLLIFIKVDYKFKKD